MAGTTISGLNPDTSIDGTEVIPSSQAGVTKKVTVNSIRGFIIPSGGTTGQVLVKLSDDDFDVAWADQTGGDTLTLDTPANFTATPGDTTMSLTWDAVTNATGYTLLRNTVNTTSGATSIYTGATPSFGDTGLSNGTLYYYFVKATAPGYTASANATTSGTPTVAAVDTKPRFGLGPAAFTSGDLETLLASMTPLTGSSNGGRAGTFSLTTTAGNFGWVAVEASVSSSGVHFFDGLGFAGWSGAGLAGNNTGASDDPSVSSVTYDDGETTWRFFRQDYINANPSASTYTLS